MARWQMKQLSSTTTVLARCNRKSLKGAIAAPTVSYPLAAEILGQARVLPHSVVAVKFQGRWRGEMLGDDGMAKIDTVTPNGESEYQPSLSDVAFMFTEPAMMPNDPPDAAPVPKQPSILMYSLKMLTPSTRNRLSRSCRFRRVTCFSAAPAATHISHSSPRTRSQAALSTVGAGTSPPIAPAPTIPANRNVDREPFRRRLRRLPSTWR